MQFTISTYLTILRVILVPFFILTSYLPFSWSPCATSIIFIIASITDCVDGFLARLLKQTTRFGAFLDPVADKIMVVIALVLIVEYFHTWWITLAAISIISREIVISSLREWMAEIGKKNKVLVSWLSKIKTTLQMFSLFVLLWHPNAFIVYIGIISLYFAAIFSLWSMIKYFSIAHNDLLNNR